WLSFPWLSFPLEPQPCGWDLRNAAARVRRIAAAGWSRTRTAGGSRARAAPGLRSLLEEVVVVGQPATVTGDVAALFDADRADVHKLPQRSVDAVHRAAQALGEDATSGEPPPLAVRVPGEQGEEPDGAIRDRGVEQPGGDAAEG